MLSLTILPILTVGLAQIASGSISNLNAGYSKLQNPIDTSGSRRRASGETWSAVEQDDSICKSKSLQFTGTVNVTEHKSIFFWFVESQQDPNNRPLVVWLNGGPGASSLSGLFTEIGPCLLSKSGDETVFNPHSWTNYVNVLFVDQPVGVGFSTVDNDEELPTTLSQAAIDFTKFLETFLTKIFPQYSKNAFYIAGESFGGRYAPRFATHISGRLADGSLDATRFPKVSGLILVDAMVDATYADLGLYDMLCGGYTEYFQFSAAICDAMASAVPECERLGTVCRETLDVKLCKAAGKFCSENIAVYFDEERDSGRRSPYDIRKSCPNPPVCIEFNTSSLIPYLNNPDIQKFLEFASPIKFQPVNFLLNSRWSMEPEMSLPTTSDLTYLLDVVGARLLVINGDLDVTINTPGMMRQYDDLPWHQQAKYRIQPWSSWFWSDEEGVEHVGGELKSVDQLTFAGVESAGHMAPGDQKAAVSSLVKDWFFSA